MKQMTEVERCAAEFLAFFHANTPPNESASDDDYPLSLSADNQETANEVLRLLKNLEFSLIHAGFHANHQLINLSNN